jgi:L-fuconolactonase
MGSLGIRALTGFVFALGIATLLACAGGRGSEGPTEPQIIDTHTHFWDPGRPIPPGRPKPVPFSNGRTVLPNEYVTAARKAGISGTVVVEASGWVEDNEWVLGEARKNPIIIGVIGNLNEVLGTPRFAEVLDKLSADPIFRGIRLSKAEDLARPEWQENLGFLARKGLTADLNAGGIAALETVAAHASRFPTLKIVLDHAAYIDFGKPPTSEWIRAFEHAAAAPNVYCKVSRFQEQAGAKPAPSDPGHYRATLDVLWRVFGEDRLLFGSNWPLSESAGSLRDAVAIMKAYFDQKGAEAPRKFFSGNAKSVYGWVER